MTAEKKPNILFILADDLGWADVGFHGAPIRTPVLDRLAATGVELHGHCVCPVCTPSRAALLSGRFPGRFGTHACSPSNAPVFPDGYPTLATVLRDSGYSTGLFGKWHLGSRPEVGPNQFGFDVAYGSLAGGVDPYNHRYKKGKYSVTWHRNGEFVEDRGHVTDLITDEAIHWLERQDGPWFCYVPFTAVHFPVKAPQEWLDRYAGVTFDSDPDKDASYREYAAYTSHMDAAIGRLIETLERLCIRDNTLVVFTSDNGSPESTPVLSAQKYPGHQPGSPRSGSNLPWRGKKATLYEGAIRTPTLANWPGKLAPGRMPHRMHLTDWMPTLCALAGCTPAVDPVWDGRNIWRNLSDPGAPAPDDHPVYCNLKGDQFSLHLGRWKLLVRDSAAKKGIELYDLVADAGERNNLANENPDVVARLRAEIDRQRARDGVSIRPDVDGPDVENPEAEP